MTFGLENFSEARDIDDVPPGEFHAELLSASHWSEQGERKTTTDSDRGASLWSEQGERKPTTDSDRGASLWSEQGERKTTTDSDRGASLHDWRNLVGQSSESDPLPEPTISGNPVATDDERSEIGVVADGVESSVMTGRNIVGTIGENARVYGFEMHKPTKLALAKGMLIAGLNWLTGNKKTGTPGDYRGLEAIPVTGSEHFASLADPALTGNPMDAFPSSGQSQYARAINTGDSLRIVSNLAHLQNDYTRPSGEYVIADWLG